MTQPLPSIVSPAPNGVPSRPDDVPQDLRPRHPLGGRPLGQRGGRLLEVDAVELHPPAVRLHQRARFGGQAGDVGGRELDVVEHRRPAHVAELVGADHGVALRVDEEAEGGGRLATGQRGHAHLEAGRLERGTGDGHQLPRLVLAQVHLAAAQPTRPPELVVDPLEPDDLVREVLGALAVGERLLDREQAPLGAAPEHVEEPGVTLVRRIELDHEGGLGHAAHLVGPLVESLGHLRTGRDRCRERGAVEVGHERLTDVSGVADYGWGGRSFELLAGFERDGVDDRADHLDRDGARILAGEHRHRPGHRAGEPGDLGIVDARRRPSDVEVHHLSLGVAMRAQARDDATLGHQPHRGDRDAAQPADAGADAVFVALAAADGDDEPAERLLDRDRQGRGLQPVR